MNYSEVIDNYVLCEMDHPDWKAEAEGKTWKVYFIYDGRYVKIGMAKHPYRRLQFLRTGNPYDLRILFFIHCVSKEDALRLERFLHRLFGDYKVAREWFDIYDILQKEYIGLNYDGCSMKWKEEEIKHDS